MQRTNMKRAALLAASLFAIGLPAGAALAAPAADRAAMLELADQSRCLTCHDVDETVRGPAWRDVAKRYRGQDVEEQLVKKVYEGGGGVWGNDSMSSNKRAGMDNIRTLVRWILALP